MSDMVMYYQTKLGHKNNMSNRKSHILITHILFKYYKSGAITITGNKSRVLPPTPAPPKKRSEVVDCHCGSISN